MISCISELDPKVIKYLSDSWFDSNWYDNQVICRNRWELFYILSIFFSGLFGQLPCQWPLLLILYFGYLMNCFGYTVVRSRLPSSKFYHSSLASTFPKETDFPILPIAIDFAILPSSLLTFMLRTGLSVRSLRWPIPLCHLSLAI